MKTELPKRIDFGNGWYGRLGALYAKDYYVVFGPAPFGESDEGPRMHIEQCDLPDFQAFAAAMTRDTTAPDALAARIAQLETALRAMLPRVTGAKLFVCQAIIERQLAHGAALKPMEDTHG